jgi:hypothetical protein
MHNFTPPISPSWTVRALELIKLMFGLLVRRGHPGTTVPAFRWTAMRSIDFEGEDTSLTEKQIGLFR